MRVLVRAPLEDIDEHGVGGSIKREFTVTTKTLLHPNHKDYGHRRSGVCVKRLAFV